MLRHGAMLLRIRDLRGDRIHAEDGEVGSVDELYFDDEAWDVRYLAVDTRRWIPGRKYFVSPIAIGSWSTTRPGRLPMCSSTRAAGFRAACCLSRRR